jgi:hypothetical protein
VGIPVGTIQFKKRPDIPRIPIFRAQSAVEGFNSKLRKIPSDFKPIIESASIDNIPRKPA